MAKKMIYPSDEASKFIVRLPDGMRERLAAAAEANGRSMNSEVVLRLQQSFGAGGQHEVLERLERIEMLLAYLMKQAGIDAGIPTIS